LIFGGLGSAEEKIKFAYVDLQKALIESEAGKKAKEKFQAQVTKLQSGLEKQKSEIEKLKADIEKKASVLREEERRSMEREYQRKFTVLQQDYKDSQAELQQKDNELTAEILKDLSEVIQEIGRKEGYTLILEKANGVLLYANAAIDITPKVIANYNAKQADQSRKKK
jgi:outer membrane protein